MKADPTLSQAQHRTASLVLMSASIQGMRQEGLGALLGEVADTLCQQGLRENAAPELQDQLVCVVIDIMGTAEEKCADGLVSCSLVWVLLQLVAATEEGSDAYEQALQGIQTLAEICDLASSEALLKKHYPTILKHMLPSEGDGGEKDFPWKNKSPPCLLFDSMIRHGGAAVAEHVAQFVPVLMAHLTPSNEPELRLFFLAMLETALGDSSLNKSFMPFMGELLLESIMPNAVWRAGRVSSTVRKVTIACLYTLLKQGLANQQCLFKTAAQILPVLKGSLDDTDANTRHLTCLCFQHLFLALPGALSGESKPNIQLNSEVVLLSVLCSLVLSFSRSLNLSFYLFSICAPCLFSAFLLCPLLLSLLALPSVVLCFLFSCLYCKLPFLL